MHLTPPLHSEKNAGRRGCIQVFLCKMMKIYTCKCKKNRSLPLSVIEKAITQFYNFYFIFKHCWEFDIENKLNIFIGDNKVQVTFVFEINCDMLLGNIIDPGQHFALYLLPIPS